MNEPGATTDPEKLRDIQPIHRWPPDARLGANSARPLPPGGAHLVLSVKGEVFRRYPNTVVINRDQREFHDRAGLLHIIQAAGLPPF